MNIENSNLLGDMIAEMQVSREQLERDLLNGSCSTLDTYKWKAGIIRGLNLAEDIMHGEVKKLNDKQNIGDDDD